MQANPKISVIVPVYNVEKFLPRCLDSLLAQTFSDFEILLIDDGSKDRSGNICDNYAFKDQRIRVFHKENGGVASARQLGVDEARGEYSIHADGDDWVEPDMLQCFYDKAKETNADIVIADYYIQRNNRQIYVSQKLRSQEPIDVLKDILSNRLFGALWHKLIKHSLYKRYNVRFIPRINYCEDVLIFVQLLQKDLKVRYLQHGFYHYSQDNISSITSKFDNDTYLMWKRLIEQYKILLPEDFNGILRITALKTKIEAVKNELINADEYYRYYPSNFFDSFSFRLTKREKLFALLSYLKMYHLGKLLLKK